MIRLEVQDYCDNCLEFEPDMESPCCLYDGDKLIHQSDTIIRCKHQDLCKNIKQRLERDLLSKGKINAE